MFKGNKKSTVVLLFLTTKQVLFWVFGEYNKYYYSTFVSNDVILIFLIKITFFSEFY